jgi:hypothetical protein
MPPSPTPDTIWAAPSLLERGQGKCPGLEQKCGIAPKIVPHFIALHKIDIISAQVFLASRRRSHCVIQVDVPVFLVAGRAKGVTLHPV